MLQKFQEQIFLGHFPQKISLSYVIYASLSGSFRHFSLSARVSLAIRDIAQNIFPPQKYIFLLFWRNI